MNAFDPIALGEDIQRLVSRLGEAGSASVADAQRLVHDVLSLHGAGLSRLLEIIRDEAGTEALLSRVASDPLVASLLALHELQPHLQAQPLLQIARSSTSQRSGERTTRAAQCELCAAMLPQAHAHLVDVKTRRLLCACSACSAVGGKYRLVPSRYLHLSSMTITAAEWDPLDIPVGLVFFVVNSQLGRTVACYPGPAGAAESVLPLDAWPALVARHVWIQQLEPDVEALLVRRNGEEYRCFIVPLDAGYELVGRIRKAWTGFAGGDGVDREIDRFFAEVLRKAERDDEVPA
jgi:hypothetical protein